MAGPRQSGRFSRCDRIVILNIATLVVAVGSYYFVRFYWGPGIVNGFLGRSAGM